jgi:hypothetical protein
LSRNLDKNVFIENTGYISQGLLVEKKAPLTIALISAILVITSALITDVVIANFTPYMVFLPEIVIKSNGSIVPETEFINHTGNVYTLTGDISNYSLVIQCNNITLDGKGYVINGSQPEPYYVVSYGLTLDHVTNVTVKDLEIAGFNDYEAIVLKDCFGCSIVRVKTSSINLQGGYFNTIAENAINSLDMENSKNNIVAKNVIGRLVQFVSHNNVVTDNNITSIIVQFCDSNRYYRNNFLSADNSFQYYFSNKESFWDNGSIGNYWSDYLTRFPNASEIGSSGIGDTPYEINQVNKAWMYGELVDVTWIRGHIIDHYPLMAPVDFVAPSIKVLSPENKTYYAIDVALNFTVNEPFSSVRYELDGETVSEISRNTTLNGLAYGAHNLTVYAVDAAGNTGASETIRFTIAESEPFPTELAITASGATVAAVGVGLLFYFKKRKR